jgi:hypothetical protein
MQPSTFGVKFRVIGTLTSAFNKTQATLYHLLTLINDSILP